LERLRHNKAAGWLIFLFILLAGYLIRVIDGYNIVYFTLLFAAILLVIPFRHAFGALQVNLSRVLLGLLFVFSGFVKGVDPVGTKYRIEDYFIAFGTDWAGPLAMTLSIILNAWEFILGIILLFNIRMKLTRWPLLVTMIFFTVITINDAFNNPVPDCGCFGDALIITNWQTLYKNLVINALLLIVFFAVERSDDWFNVRTEVLITLAFFMGFLGFEAYNIRHLPVLDFRDWKVGKRMVHENPLPKQYYLTYRHIETGEEKEYLSPDYPYNDSVWVATHEFVRQRIVDPNPPLHTLHLEDAAGNDLTASVVASPDRQYILVAEDLDLASLKHMERIREFARACEEHGIPFVAVTSSLPEQVERFKETNQLGLDFYYADDVTLKAMIRSNPGLILMQDGVVKGKWHHNDWPEGIR
jgi:uncharacterized membrane protein YphA (DoxX/SURF4 family)